MSEKQAPPTAAELVTTWVDAYARGGVIEHDERLRSAARAVADRLGVELAPEEPERTGWFMKQELPAVAIDEGCGSHSCVVAADCLFKGNEGSNVHYTLRDLVEAHNRAVRALRELEEGPEWAFGTNSLKARRILRDGKP